MYLNIILKICDDWAFVSWKIYIKNIQERRYTEKHTSFGHSEIETGLSTERVQPQKNCEYPFKSYLWTYINVYMIYVYIDR